MNTMISWVHAAFDGDRTAPHRELAWLSRPLNSAEGQDEWRELYMLGLAFMGFLWVIVSPLKPKIRIRVCIDSRDLRFLDPAENSRSKAQFLSAREAPSLPYYLQAFQVSYENNRGHLYTRIFKTSLFRADRAIVSVGVLGILLPWFIRSSVQIHNLDPNNGFFEPATLRTNIAAVATVHEIVLPFASMALSVVAILHVWWLYKLIDYAWELQGKLYDLALLLSSVLMTHRADSRVQDAFWTIYRHLNLIHIFTYAHVSESVWMESDDLDKVQQCNLLTPVEAEELEQVEDRLSLVSVWLADMLNRLVDAELVPRVFSGSLLESYSEINSAAAAFIEQARRSSKMVPTAARRVIELAVDIMILLTPAALAHLFSKDDSVFPCYFWPCVGSMVTAMCFQGVVFLVKALDQPFENHLDALNPDYVLYLTERRIFACLAGGENWPPLPSPASASMGRLLRPHIGGEVGRSDRAESADLDPAVIEHTVGSIDGDDHDDVGSEHVADKVHMGNAAAVHDVDQTPPHEEMPTDVHWVPQEVGGLGLDSHVTNTTQQAALPDTGILDEKYVKGARWGNLDRGLLQATKAALLVPREITLDQVSLERLETVTARPLAEIAAAIFRAERAEARRVEADAGLANGNSTLALEDDRIQQQFASPRHPNLSEGNETASSAVGLFGAYEEERHMSSNLKEQIARLKAQDIVAAAESAKRPKEKPNFHAKIADV